MNKKLLTVRWGGFKALRERWQAHLENTLLRPVLLIDEAQEMSPVVLCELRLRSYAPALILDRS